METLRIALCQIDALVGDVEGNLDLVRAALIEAEANSADLAVFPELVLSGYPPEDLLHAPAFVAENARALRALIAETKRCVAIVGFVEQTGAALHNSAAVLSEGQLHGIWRKELLPNYGVFDERRWFVPGTGATPLFSIAGVRCAVTICEDAWTTTGPLVRQGKAGAELIISINASPFRLGALEERATMLAARALEAGAPIVYVNLVGAQDELIFDGASMVFDQSGMMIHRTPQFESEVSYVDLNVAPREVPDAGIALPVVTLSEPHASRARAWPPCVAAEMDDDEQVYAALVSATRGYVHKNGFSDVVIALSGGIDSSLVAAIAVDALGPSAVHGVLMPSRYSSRSSVDDATTLSERLGIDSRVVPIEPIHGPFLELLAPIFTGREPDLTEENLQARLRGTLMMALSNKFGWLVLTTGNKSETAVGYSTMYGDSAGGFAVIKDVPKTLVYRLCALRNARAGIDLIPNAIFEKPPSAELRPDQRDDDSLPPYEILDPILEGYVERDLSVAELVAAGADESVARRVVDLVDHAEYKRRQSPLGPRVTSRGFGRDRRMPITNRFRASRGLIDSVAKR